MASRYGCPAACLPLDSAGSPLTPVGSALLLVSLSQKHEVGLPRPRARKAIVFLGCPQKTLFASSLINLWLAMDCNDPEENGQ
jgi:hypothetical protein